MIELGLDRNREESMANRNIQQKILKNKRRGRYARFSGSTTRVISRTVQVLEQEGEDKVRVKDVEVYVGPVSLSKQVISTGRGPDKERLREYFERVHSYDQSLPDVIFGSHWMGSEKYSTERRSESGLRLKLPDIAGQYAEFIKGIPREMRIRLVDNTTGTLDLYFNMTQFFFVDVDYRKHFIRRSTIYPTKKRALDALKDQRVRWVEVLSSPKKAPKFERIGSGNPVAPPKS